MSLKHLPSNSLSLLLGIVLAFLIIASPHAARATDTCDVDAKGDFYNAYLTSLHNQAGQITTVHHDFMKNRAPTLDIKLHYCTLLINDIIRAIAVASNPKGALAIALFQGIILAFLNQLCSVAVSIVTDLTSLLTSKYNFICISMPQLHFGVHLPSTNTCPGYSLISLQAMGTQSNASGPSNWNIWGGVPLYVPKQP
jgi:hypothetical protein